MVDQSVAQRQPSSLGRAGFAAFAVLAVCFLLSALSRGLGQSFTVFLLPISETFGWNRGQIISVYSVASLATAVASPLVGRMFDRFGPRVVYSLALIVLGGDSWLAPMGSSFGSFRSSSGCAWDWGSPASEPSPIRPCSGVGLVRDCRPRWRLCIPPAAPAC